METCLGKLRLFWQIGWRAAYHLGMPSLGVQRLLYLRLRVECLIANRVPAFVLRGVNVSPVLQHFLLTCQPQSHAPGRISQVHTQKY